MLFVINRVAVFIKLNGGGRHKGRHCPNVCACCNGGRLFGVRGGNALGNIGRFGGEHLGLNNVTVNQLFLEGNNGVALFIGNRFG